MSPVSQCIKFSYISYLCLNARRGQLSRGEDIFPDLLKVGDENTAFWELHVN